MITQIQDAAVKMLPILSSNTGSYDDDSWQIRSWHKWLLLGGNWFKDKTLSKLVYRHYPKTTLIDKIVWCPTLFTPTFQYFYTDISEILHLWVLVGAWGNGELSELLLHWNGRQLSERIHSGKINLQPSQDKTSRWFSMRGFSPFRFQEKPVTLRR